MKYLFFILSITLFSNCRHEKKQDSNFVFYPPVSDSANFRTKFIEERIAAAKRYNLSTLTSGTNDSIIIRFWPWEAFEPWSNMFEFRLDSNGWKGYHYCSYTFPNQDGKILHIYGHETLGDSVFVVKQIIPKCGWDKFYDSLNFFQLRSLPTQQLIKNIIRDGDGVQFEIATKNSYRWISYDNPSSYGCPDCRTIVKLWDMLIREFGDDYFWPKIKVKKVRF